MSVSRLYALIDGKHMVPESVIDVFVLMFLASLNQSPLSVQEAHHYHYDQWHLPYLVRDILLT